MTGDRHLDWEGCANIRDLGGLRTKDGKEIRRGAVVRADGLDRLTANGWSALWDYGIRTVIDLRNADEIEPDNRPVGLTTVKIPLDSVEDKEFWDHWGKGLNCTPLYYRSFLDRFPQRVAKVITAIARAEPGGVVFHCSAGRDRTGLVALVLLTLLGVPAEDIAADHALSTERLQPGWEALGHADQGPLIEAILARENTTAHDALVDAVTSVNVKEYSQKSGLREDDLDAVRTRLT